MCNVQHIVTNHIELWRSVFSGTKSSTALSLHWMTSHVFIQKMHYSLASCQLYFLVPLSSFLAHLLAYSHYIKNLQPYYTFTQMSLLPSWKTQIQPIIYICIYFNFDIYTNMYVRTSHSTRYRCFIHLYCGSLCFDALGKYDFLATSRVTGWGQRVFSVLSPQQKTSKQTES